MSVSKDKPAVETLRVKILHGNYVHVQPTLTAKGDIDVSVPYGHDIPAVTGDVIALPRIEAERLVSGGSAELVKA